MSWLFSQALVEEYLGDTCLDGEQSVPLNGRNIQQAYCAPDKMTDFSRLSRFGMMFKPLTENLGQELLMSFLEDFRVKTFLSLGGGDGLDGERSGMWREMARIIGEVRPKYCFVENSPMLTSRGLGTVLRDLAQLGFNAEWGVLGADEVGANHKRKRIWIVAHSNSNSNFWAESKSNGIQNQTKGITGSQHSSTWQFSGASSLLRKNALQRHEKTNMAHTSFESISNESNSRSNIGFDEQQGKGAGNINGSCSQKNVSNPSSIRQQGQRKHEQSINSTQNSQRQTNYAESIGRPEFWSVEPSLGRVANGVAYRLDRLKAIGNGQVPLCAATAWRLLNERI
jgi:DNA (cytosine-5)-methyltransferase 1